MRREKLREHFKAQESERLRAVVEQWKVDGVYAYEGEATSPVGVTGQDAVAVERVDRTGAAMSPSRGIAEGNPLSLTWYEMVRRGPDAVLAWTVWAQSGVKLARVSP